MIIITRRRRRNIRQLQPCNAGLEKVSLNNIYYRSDEKLLRDNNIIMIWLSYYYNMITTPRNILPFQMIQVTVWKELKC